MVNSARILPFGVAAALAVLMASSAQAQDPMEAVIGLGMGAAMTAVDIFSQGAAIRGSSNTQFDILGQQLSDSRNAEAGFGQAIQTPDGRRRRSADPSPLMISRIASGKGKRRTTPEDSAFHPVYSAKNRKEGGKGKHRTTPDDIAFRKNGPASPLASNKSPQHLGRMIMKMSNGGLAIRNKRAAAPCGGGGGRRTPAPTTVAPDEVRRKREARPCEGEPNMSTTAGVPSDRKKRELDERETAEQLQAAMKRMMEAARAVMETVRAVFGEDRTQIGDQVEMM